METARFLRLRSLFDAALSIPPDEQDAFLERECHGDEKLLVELRALKMAHDAAIPTRSPDPRNLFSDTPQLEEEMIGPYRLRTRIGEGGMGSVYLAIRDDGTFRKSVAIKIVRKDSNMADLVERFQQERQVLANLDHGNIARILDGGETADGLPYFVMEYVKGLPLDKFCDDRKLDLAARVRLFLQVCCAVDYLHENLVIHRDLKPTNILVTAESVVKLLDFGIAKQQIESANAELTAVQGRLLTPGYASPEQFANSPVSKSSDIYALGVLLYLLLTGSLPHADPGDKLTKEPSAPSTKIREDIQRTSETTSQLRRRIVGDLDQVVLKCLRRDPRNRYATAKDLADDLQLFLDGRPVTARKGPVTERALRFVKRNRVAIGIAVALLALGTFGISEAFEARRHAHEVMTLEAELAKLLDSLENKSDASVSPSVRAANVRKLREALKSDLAIAGSTFTPQRRALLERGMNYLDKVKPFAADDPSLASEVAAAWKVVGVIYQPTNAQVALTAFNNATILQSVSENAVTRSTKGRQIPPVEREANAVNATAAPEASLNSATLPLQEAPQSVQSNPALPFTQTKPVIVEEGFATQFTLIEAKTRTADTVIAALRSNAQQIGEILHPDIETMYVRMKLAVDAARKARDEGDMKEANENLGIANAAADRVLKAGGR